MFKMKRTFDIIGIACLAVCLLAAWTQAEVLYGDDFNRGYWNQEVGSTSVGNYVWFDNASDSSKIYNDILSISGNGGYRSLYVQYNLDSYASYTVEFDLQIAADQGGVPQLFLSPRSASDASVGQGWGIVNSNNSAVLLYQGVGVGVIGQAGKWIHFRVDVVNNTTTLYAGSVTDVRTTSAVFNDSSADYMRFGYYWAGDYGLNNFQIDNLTVVSPKTSFVCGDIAHPYPAGDFNHDCYIDLTDFAILAEQWMECTSPDTPCNYKN